MSEIHVYKYNGDRKPAWSKRSPEWKQKGLEASHCRNAHPSKYLPESEMELRTTDDDADFDEPQAPEKESMTGMDYEKYMVEVIKGHILITNDKRERSQSKLPSSPSIIDGQTKACQGHAL
jgi:hypothetical protein